MTVQLFFTTSTHKTATTRQSSQCNTLLKDEALESTINVFRSHTLLAWVTVCLDLCQAAGTPGIRGGIATRARSWEDVGAMEVHTQTKPCKN